jgi:hypothetical protein
MWQCSHTRFHTHTHTRVMLFFWLWPLRDQILPVATNDFLIHFSCSIFMHNHTQVYVYGRWLHVSHNQWWILMLIIDSTAALPLRIDTPPSLILCYTIIYQYNTIPTSSPIAITLSTLLPYPNTSNIIDRYHLPRSFSSFIRHTSYNITTTRQQYMLYPTWPSTIHQYIYHHASQKLIPY